jgi:hypothetical protein
MFSALRKTVLAFCLGALTFTPWEILMARLDIVQYTKPEFLGISWWSPVGFGVATSLAIMLFVALDRLLHAQIDYQGGKLVLEYLLLALVYTLILLFRSSPYLLSLGLLLLMVLRLIFFHQPWDVLVFLIGACAGPTVELILTNLNLYFFTEPDFLGMPYWLPLLWGAVGLAVRRLSWILSPPPAPATLYSVKL